MPQTYSEYTHSLFYKQSQKIHVSKMPDSSNMISASVYPLYIFTLGQVSGVFGQYKMQTADSCRPLFSPWKWEQDNNGPIAF